MSFWSVVVCVIDWVGSEAVCGRNERWLRVTESQSKTGEYIDTHSW
jgi:hypothetical protein